MSILLMFVPPAILFAPTITITTIDTTSQQRIGLCLDCNYALQGLPTPRCPECGREFDPADSDTFNPGRSIPWWAAWAMGPISWPVDFIVSIGMAVTLWRARLPATTFTFHAPVLWGWLALAMVWLIWPALRRIVLAHFGWPARAIRRGRRAFWVIPLLMIAMVVVLDLQLPRYIAFRRSQAAMAAVARDVMANPHGQHDNRWIGLYYAKRLRALPGGFRFTAQDDDVQFKAGFEYMPKLSPNNAFHGYQQLGDGWWSWREEG